MESTIDSGRLLQGCCCLLCLIGNTSGRTCMGPWGCNLPGMGQAPGAAGAPRWVQWQMPLLCKLARASLQLRLACLA